MLYMLVWFSTSYNDTLPPLGIDSVLKVILADANISGRKEVAIETLTEYSVNGSHMSFVIEN